MTTTPSTAGSATGIDLDALTAIQDRLALAYRLCLSLAPKQAVGELLETATNMPEWETVRAALARATPQHPAKPATSIRTLQFVSLMNAWRTADPLQGPAAYDAITAHIDALLAATPQHPDAGTEQTIANYLFKHTNLSAESSASAAAKLATLFATPQHSVTEQASIDGDALYRAWHKVGADVAGLNFADFAAALDRPLASTAATQPEQASDLKAILDAARCPRYRETSAEGGGVALNDEGEFITLMDAQEIMDEGYRAALAIPASTAASEPVFAWLATDLDGRGDVGLTKEEAKRRAGEGCTIFIPLYDTAASEQQASVSEVEQCAHCKRLPGDPEGYCDWIECPVGSAYSVQDNILLEKHSSVEQCDECAGSGKIGPNENPNEMDCEVCHGTGRATIPSEADERPELTVWYGPMPESNGKSNFTAVLMRKDTGWDGPHVTIERGEYPDRIRYEADRVRHLIGDLSEKPDILAYDANKHSGYMKPDCAATPDTATTAADQQGGKA